MARAWRPAAACLVVTLAAEVPLAFAEDTSRTLLHVPTRVAERLADRLHRLPYGSLAEPPLLDAFYPSDSTSLMEVTEEVYAQRGFHNANATVATTGTQASQTVFPFNGRTITVPSWVHALSLTFLIKAACIICNITMQASPWRVIQNIRKVGDTGTLNPLPFLCMTLCTCQWCFYAIFAWYMTGNRGFLTILYANVLGACLGTFYISAFTANLRDPEMWRKMKFYYQCMFSIVAIECVICMVKPAKDSLWFSGMISACWSMAVGLSPFVAIREVFETGRIDCLPVDMIVTGEIGCFAWIVCGLMLDDKWILTTNFENVVVSSVLLCIIAWYHPVIGSLLGNKRAAELRAKSRDIETPAEDSAAMTASSFAAESTSDSEKQEAADETSPLVPRFASPGTGGTGETPDLPTVEPAPCRSRSPNLGYLGY